MPQKNSMIHIMEVVLLKSKTDLLNLFVTYHNERIIQVPDTRTGPSTQYYQARTNEYQYTGDE
jgi:hypothetical protein